MLEFLPNERITFRNGNFKIEKLNRDAKLGGDLKAGWKRLTTGEKGYTTSSQQIINKFGDRTISSIVVKRSPVSVGFIVKTFDLIKDKTYSDLFHLYMIVTFTDGKKIVCEKNEVINLSKTIPKENKETEKMPVMVSSGLTLNTMLNNAMKSMGEHSYFSYNAINNNCQNYLLALITYSNMTTPTLTTFIKQDVKGLLGRTAQTSVNALTNVAGTFNTFVN